MRIADSAFLICAANVAGNLAVRAAQSPRRVCFVAADAAMIPPLNLARAHGMAS